MSGSLAVLCGRRNISSVLLDMFSLSWFTQFQLNNSIYFQIRVQDMRKWSIWIVHIITTWEVTRIILWKCPKTREFTVRSGSENEETFPFSEQLEWKVDQLDPKSRKPERFDQKYTYFMAVPKLQKALWPSIAAVFLVIFFFFIGLLMCCCSLMMYALVEEGSRGRSNGYRNPIIQISGNETKNASGWRLR